METLRLEGHDKALKDIFGEGNVEWTSKTTISQSERLKIVDFYGNEEETCLHFLLNRLGSYYLDKYILSAKRENNFAAKRDVLNEKDTGNSCRHFCYRNSRRT